MRVCNNCEQNLRNGMEYNQYYDILIPLLAYKKEAAKGQVIIRGKQKLKKENSSQENTIFDENSKALKSFFGGLSSREVQTNSQSRSGIKVDEKLIFFAIVALFIIYRSLQCNCESLNQGKFFFGRTFFT